MTQISYVLNISDIGNLTYVDPCVAYLPDFYSWQRLHNALYNDIALFLLAGFIILFMSWNLEDKISSFYRVVGLVCLFYAIAKVMLI